MEPKFDQSELGLVILAKEESTFIPKGLYRIVGVSNVAYRVVLITDMEDGHLYLNTFSRGHFYEGQLELLPITQVTDALMVLYGLQPKT